MRTGLERYEIEMRLYGPLTSQIQIWRGPKQGHGVRNTSKLGDFGVKSMLSNQVKSDTNLLKEFRSYYKLPVYGGDPLEGSRPRFIGSQRDPKRSSKGSRIELK